MNTVPNCVGRTAMGQTLLVLFTNFFQFRCILPYIKTKTKTKPKIKTKQKQPKQKTNKQKSPKKKIKQQQIKLGLLCMHRAVEWGRHTRTQPSTLLAVLLTKKLLCSHKIMSLAFNNSFYEVLAPLPTGRDLHSCRLSFTTTCARSIWFHLLFFAFPVEGCQVFAVDSVSWDLLSEKSTNMWLTTVWQNLSGIPVLSFQPALFK